MNTRLMEGWYRTTVIPTSVSALCCTLFFVFLAVSGLPGGLHTISLVFFWGVLGVPATFFATSVAWFLLRHASENDQSRIGMALAIGTPVAVFLLMLAVS